MKYRLINIKARDGIYIPCSVWDGDGDIIIYIHGLESHMGWFIDMAERFQKKGFCIYAFDRRGSGLSNQIKGHIESYKILIDDLLDVITMIRIEHPGRKIYLMGMCGGGRLAVCFVGYRPNSVDGVILVSPAIKTQITLPFLKKIDIVFSSFFSPKKKFPLPIQEEMFTKNEKFLSFIKNDKMRLHYLTARFYRELVVMDFVLSKRIFNVKLPILTILAADDAIVDNDRVKKWHYKLQTPDKTLKVFEGCCHFLPFQENIDEIVNFITRWIQRHSVLPTGC